MVNLLTKLFVKNRDNTQDPAVRRAFGSLSSVVGILLNVLLFAIKFIAGTLTGSLSIRADAVNNLSDAGSSVVSLVSFKISAKPADRGHSFKSSFVCRQVFGGNAFWSGLHRGGRSE